MNESELIGAIQVGITNFNLWTVGITEDTERRKAEHKSKGENIDSWREWRADTETIARNVESYFLKKGMKGGSGGVGHPTFVYIF